MIITRTPLRIPVGGGGTDLPEYYSRFGSHLITAAINQHIFVFVQRWFENGIKVTYSRTEIVSCVDEIQHPVAREALRFVNVVNNIEILSMAELPSNTGLGSSGAYTVGLLNALHAYAGRQLTTHDLAELACHLQTNVLKEAGGKQDQYAAAFGGFIIMDIDRDGRVTIKPLEIQPDIVEELENNTLYFYTGIRRSSVELQSRHSEALRRGDKNPIDSLHRIKEIGHQIEDALTRANLDGYGQLLHTHWETKHRISSDMSPSLVDHAYAKARDAGVLGGKLVGAGGGGFLMLYCPNGKKTNVRHTMRAEGLQEVKLRFESSGSKVLLHL